MVRVSNKIIRREKRKFLDCESLTLILAEEARQCTFNHQNTVAADLYNNCCGRRTVTIDEPLGKLDAVGKKEVQIHPLPPWAS